MGQYVKAGSTVRYRRITESIFLHAGAPSEEIILPRWCRFLWGFITSLVETPALTPIRAAHPGLHSEAL